MDTVCESQPWIWQFSGNINIDFAVVSEGEVRNFFRNIWSNLYTIAVFITYFFVPLFFHIKNYWTIFFFFYSQPWCWVLLHPILPEHDGTQLDYTRYESIKSKWQGSGPRAIIADTQTKPKDWRGWVTKIALEVTKVTRVLSRSNSHITPWHWEPTRC